MLYVILIEVKEERLLFCCRIRQWFCHWKPYRILSTGRILQSPIKSDVGLTDLRILIKLMQR